MVFIKKGKKRMILMNGLSLLLFCIQLVKKMWFYSLFHEFFNWRKNQWWWIFYWRILLFELAFVKQFFNSSAGPAIFFSIVININENLLTSEEMLAELEILRLKIVRCMVFVIFQINFNADWKCMVKASIFLLHSRQSIIIHFKIMLIENQSFLIQKSSLKIIYQYDFSKISIEIKHDSFFY